MAFFDQKIIDKNNEENNILNEEITNEINTKQQNNSELEINRKNREAYESLMEESKSKLDSYYDTNNIFVKLVLFLLFVFIVCGIIYYVLLYIKAR